MKKMIFIFLMMSSTSFAGGFELPCDYLVIKKANQAGCRVTNIATTGAYESREINGSDYTSIVHTTGCQQAIMVWESRFDRGTQTCTFAKNTNSWGVRDSGNKRSGSGRSINY